MCLKYVENGFWWVFNSGFVVGDNDGMFNEDRVFNYGFNECVIGFFCIG